MSFRPKLSGVIAASLCFALFAACSDGGDSNRNPSPGGGDTQTPVDKDKDKDKDPDPQPTKCPAVVDCSLAVCAGQICGNQGICENLTCVEPVAESQIGDACTGATNAKPAGSCVGADMLCNAVEYQVFSRQNADPANFTTCTKQCKTSTDCGSTNGVNNFCVGASGGTKGYCISGCNPDNDTCSNDSTCVPYSFGSTCVLTCTQNTDCNYGLTCTSVTSGSKVCDPQPCGAGGVCQGAGRTCNVSLKNANFPNGLCVDACTENSCGPGKFCNADKICEFEGETYYQPCENAGDCPSHDAICAFFEGSDTQGVCLQNCTQTGGCGGTPANGECAVGNEQVQACVLPCTKDDDCPADSGTTCKPLGGSKFCIL